MPSKDAKLTIDEDELDNLAGPLEAAAPSSDDDEDEEGSDMDDGGSSASGEQDTEQQEAPLLPDSASSRMNGAPRAGLGAPSRPGLGQAPVVTPAFNTNQNLPSAFGATARPSRSFLNLSKSNTASPSSTPKTALTNDEKRHFASLESKGGIGFKLLSKMGWNSGSGLGAKEEGRINPVDQQLRPKGMGIGHDGYREKTKGSIAEAKRSVWLPSCSPS